MDNNFLTPDNENKKHEPESAPVNEQEIFTYTDMPEEVDVFDDSPIVTQVADDEISDFDETADVFDRPVCENPDSVEICDVPSDSTTEDTPAESEEFILDDIAIPEYTPESVTVTADETYPQAPVQTQPQPFAGVTPQYTPPYTPSVTPTPPQPAYTQPPIAHAPAENTIPSQPQAVAQPQPTPFESYAAVQPAPMVKKNKGSTAFLIILWVLVGVFALGFFGLCGYIIGTSGNGANDATRPTLFNEEPTTSATEPADDAENKPDTSLPSARPMPDDNELYSDSTSLELKGLPADSANATKYTTQYAYKKVSASTIGVVCYEEGFGDEPASEGTGIILTEDGYIITNSHVIGDSRSLFSVQVVTHDGEKYSAKVIGYDSRTDIAVLKISASGLTPAEFCDSKYVEVGQDVIAVGNPGGMGFQNSLTRGVVSALNRELDLSTQVSYIQTDAAINPGNSGGPLCNMYGQVIGINTAKISSDSYEGMGFAIPSATTKDIADDLISHGYVSNRVRIGISGQAVTSSMMQYYDIPTGILVGEISKGGPCEDSGLQVNDVITAIDDEAVETFSDVYGILAKHKPGDKVVLNVYRISTDTELDITITLMADEGETQQ